jgi:hypothetical protein
MKSSVKILTFLAVLTALFSSCNPHRMRLMRAGRSGESEIHISEGKINKIDNTIEFIVNMTFNSRKFKRYDSLQIQVFLDDGQRNLYLGTLTDTHLNQQPFSHTLSKKIITKIDSGKAYDHIIVKPVIYKKRAYGEGYSLSIASVKDFQ